MRKVAPNTNNSSTGGYLLPAAQANPFGGLTFEQFIQQVFVGVSGLLPELVRNQWQPNPPKQPDLEVNWLAIGLTENEADTFAYYDEQSDGSFQFQRQEQLTVQCFFYGPQALEYVRLVRDGLQLGQNREALRSALMTHVACSRATRVPDLVNERWINRWQMQVMFRREIMRTYPVLNLLSGAGTLTLNDAGNGVNTIPIAIQGS